MSKGFWGVIAIVVLILVGIFAFSGSKDSGSSEKPGDNKPTSHIQGKGSTGVTLVEYGDYQCPFCGQFYPVVKQVQAKYNDEIFFQFRNYPLPNLHPNAFSAARAAEAADMQDKFWQMHDALYETQTQWSKLGDASSFFADLAKQLGLDMTKFKKDYASSAANNRINADQAEGEKLGVTGTPTFFIDGKKVTVTQDPASFDKAINEAIAAKKKKQ